MNLHRGKVELPGLTLKGHSTGGVETSVQVQEWSLCIDMGIANHDAVQCKNVAITHGHPDHVGALIAYLGKRLLYGLQAPRVFVESSLHPQLEAMVHAAGDAQLGTLPVEWVPMKPGDVVPLKGDLEIEAFRSVHVIPTQGYAVRSRRKKLKASFSHLSGDEIARRRKEGDDDLFYTLEKTLFAVTGDTLPEVIEREERVRNAEVLVMECTFLDEQKPVALARKGGHVHLDELIPRLEQLSCEHLVLTHFSQLYRSHEVRKILQERLPLSWRDRTYPLTGSQRART